MTRTHLKTNSNLTQQKSNLLANLLVSYTDLKMTYSIYGQAGV